MRYPCPGLPARPLPPGAHVIEATGRLEQSFVTAALAKGLPVVVVSPLKIRCYAGAIGQLAKTDAIDARLIARVGADVKPVAHAPSDPKARKIKDLMVRRRLLPHSPAWLRSTETADA
jgi:transposase